MLPIGPRCPVVGLSSLMPGLETPDVEDSALGGETHIPPIRLRLVPGDIRVLGIGPVASLGGVLVMASSGSSPSSSLSSTVSIGTSHQSLAPMHRG